MTVWTESRLYVGQLIEQLCCGGRCGGRQSECGRGQVVWGCVWFSCTGCNAGAWLWLLLVGCTGSFLIVFCFDWSWLWLQVFGFGFKCLVLAWRVWLCCVGSS